MGCYFLFSSFLGKKTFEINLKIQDQNLDPYFCFDISVLLDVQADFPETSPFFCVCPNGYGEYLFSNVYSIWDV